MFDLVVGLHGHSGEITGGRALVQSIGSSHSSSHTVHMRPPFYHYSKVPALLHLAFVVAFDPLIAVDN